MAIPLSDVPMHLAAATRGEHPVNYRGHVSQCQCSSFPLPLYLMEREHRLPAAVSVVAVQLGLRTCKMPRVDYKTLVEA